MNTLGWTDDDGLELFTLGWYESTPVDEETFGTTFINTFVETFGNTFDDTFS